MLNALPLPKQINFEGVWGELEAEKFLQRQPWTKYLRQDLVFM